MKSSSKLRINNLYLSLDKETALKDALEIYHAKPDTILKAIADFQRKYGLEIYTGRSRR